MAAQLNGEVTSPEMLVQESRAPAGGAASAAATTRVPLVSLGLPVYNGERYLRRAIEALLAQTLQDFELIICDNASTDSSPEICREYLRDPRVRYFRQPENVGVARNWNFAAAQARGQFFKWSSSNDLVEPTMLEKCVAPMLADPRIVLCYGHTRLIDEDDKQIEIYGSDLSVCDEMPSERLRRISRLGLNNAQSGLIRLAALRRTGMVRIYKGGDIVLMSELALLGHYHLLDDVLLSRRISKSTFSSMLSHEELIKFWDPKSPAVANLPRLKLHRDHVQAAMKLANPWPDKLRALGVALKNIYWDRAAVRAELVGWLH